MSNQNGVSDLATDAKDVRTTVGQALDDELRGVHSSLHLAEIQLNEARVALSRAEMSVAQFRRAQADLIDATGRSEFPDCMYCHHGLK